ncbi:MAG: M55 family metallopeptidase [Acutalibacteraceae bacterium]
MMSIAGKKFYVSVDLEGVACVVVNYGQGGDGRITPAAQKPRGRCRSRGAVRLRRHAVTVWDCHGTGVNLDYSLFDKRCTFMLGAGSRLRFPGIEEGYDGILFLGYHAYDAPAATLAHVYSSTTFQGQWINGKPVGELQIDAAVAGKRGVPVLFVAADDVCVGQAKETFPWAETVVTKKALAWNSCITSIHRPPATKFTPVCRPPVTPAGDAAVPRAVRL